MHEEEDTLTFANRLLSRGPAGDDEETGAWLSDESNVKLVDRSALLNHAVDPRQFPGLKEVELARLRERIGRRRRRLTRWLSAAASVLVISSVYLVLSREESGDGALVERVEIEPGSYRAELVLNDGNVIPLARENREIRASESVRVRNDSLEGLTYSDAGKSESAPVYNTLKVPAGGFFPVELSDGTRVWLNASSELRYPVVFGEGERVVSLSGEGYFDVKADASRPFTVQLDRSRVTVLGTSFNISAYEDEGKIHATLVQGSVLLVSETTGRQLLLKPGTQGTLDVASGALSARGVDTEVYTAWKDGIFYFKEMTLEEITRALSRWYRLEVLYDDPRLKHEKYNGKMPMYSGIEDVLRKIEMTGSVRLKIQGRTLVVSGR